MYMQIKLPLICLLILIYCVGFYSKKKVLFTRTSRVFGFMTIVAIIHLMAAVVTEYTVNNRDQVPEWFNYIWHIVFLVSLTCLCCIILFYFIVYIERGIGRQKKREKYLLFAVCIAGIVAQIFCPISYMDTPHGSYSLGMKAYALYVVLGYVLISMIYLLIRYHRVIGQEKSNVLFASVFIFILVSVVQVLFPYILLTGPAVTAIILGFMVNTEDAHRYLSYTTGLCSEYGCRELIQETLLFEVPSWLGVYVFLGDESHIQKAMLDVEDKYRTEGKKYMCGTIADNVLVVIPPLPYKRNWSRPEALWKLDGKAYRLKYDCKIIDFQGTETVDQIDEMIRNYKKRYEEKALQRDELTGLLRRNAFIRQTEYMINQRISFALLMLDLDDFKDINDTFGHNVGDAALKYVAEVFGKVVRGSDVVCRMGGDEFAIVLFGVTESEAVCKIVKRITDILERATFYEGLEYAIRLSVGVKIHRGIDGIVSFQELYTEADGALYRSKNNGKGCVTFAEDTAKDRQLEK